MLHPINQCNDKWQNCLSMIKEKISPEEFALWFEPIVPLAFDENVLKLRVPNEKHAKQIDQNYLAFFKPIIQKLYGFSTKLRYTVMIENKPEQNTVGNLSNGGNSGIKNPFTPAGVKKLIIDPQLNPNYRFENFIEGSCNKLARSAGMAVAAKPGRTAFNPLFIYGNSGLGKTHVAQAIGLEAKKQNPEMNVLYISANKFQAQFQNAMLKGEHNDFINFYQMIDLLIIDDIQELAGKVKTQNTFFNIFNNLHLSNKQLIITSDKPPIELQDIEQRLITRFKWGLTTELELPDYDTKVQIINSKAERLRVVLTDDVVEFLATNITANIREIEGALSSLAANASFLNRAITVDLAKEVLNVYVKYTKREVTLDAIMGVVCAHMQIDKEMINSTVRTREVAQARQLVMYLCKQYLKMPLAAIGLAVGGKNHATVLHACKTITNLIETDRAFKSQVEKIEKKITNV